MTQSTQKTSIRDRLSNLLLMLFYSIFFPFLCFVSIISRFNALILMKIKNKNAKMLSSNDVILHYGGSIDETMLIASFLCSGSIDIDHFRNIMWEYLKPIPRLQCYIEEHYQYYFWIKEKSFRISEHVLVHRDLSISTKDELMKIQKRLYYTQMPKRFSPWMVHFVPLNSDYEETDDKMSFYMVLVFHHSIGDIYSAMNLFFDAVSDVKLDKAALPTSFVQSRWQKAKPIIIVITMFWYMMIENYSRIKNVFDSSLLYGKIIYLDSDIFHVRTVKKIKRALNVPFRTVLLCCVMAALEKFFRNKNFPSWKGISICIPQVLWTSRDEIELRNNFIPIRLHLPINQKHCIDRLKEINSILNSTYTENCFHFNYTLMKYFGNYFPASCAQFFYRNMAVSTTLSIAGTVGYPENILGNRKMKLNMIPKRIIPFMRNVGISFQVFTLGDKMNVTASARTSIATEDDLKLIVEAFQEELMELDKSVGQSQ